MTMIGDLFKSPPSPWWGLRGDPFLWKDLARVFRKVPTPRSEAILMSMLEGAFLALTGYTIEHTEDFFVERYAHGGMSSGGVSPEFWREKAIPLLRRRFLECKADR